tara:strand:- start:1219 stop:2181 length:963 start_codon:yes stop_codon:yes gene_type:complete
MIDFSYKAFIKENIFKRIVYLFISVSCIVLIFKYFTDLDVKKITVAFHEINLFAFILSIITFCIAHYFSSRKYSLIANYVLNRSDLRVAYINYFSALFANVVPFGPSADICRIVMLNKKHKIDMIDALLITLLDRSSTLIYITIIGLILLSIHFNISSDFKKFNILILFWGIMLLIVFIIMFLPRVIFNKFKNKKIGKSKNLQKIIWGICFNKKIIFLIILHTLFLSLSFTLCAQSVLGSDLNLNFILLSPLFQIIHSVPLFFSGWGIREGVFLFLIPEKSFFITENKIFLISILVGLSVFISTLPSIFFLKRFNKLGVK